MSRNLSSAVYSSASDAKLMLIKAAHRSRFTVIPMTGNRAMRSPKAQAARGHIYGEVNSIKDIRELNRTIRQEMDRVKTREQLTELKKHAHIFSGLEDEVRGQGQSLARSCNGRKPKDRPTRK
jgi:predicted metal-dependent phosphoesterase TrpH